MIGLCTVLATVCLHWTRSGELHSIRSGHSSWPSTLQIVLFIFHHLASRPLSSRPYGLLTSVLLDHLAVSFFATKPSGPLAIGLFSLSPSCPLARKTFNHQAPWPSGHPPSWPYGLLPSSPLAIRPSGHPALWPSGPLACIHLTPLLKFFSVCWIPLISINSASF